jgi:predicted CXXCH cytochrome family protein
MRPHRAWLLLAAGAVAGMVLASGCATQTKRQWLIFFFDGVPPEKTNLVATATSAGANGQRTNEQPATVAGRPESPVVFHPPYAEGKCASCHESKFSHRLRSDLGAACVSCHKSFLAPANSWHAPAVSGECSICHEPHQSSRKFLLVKAPAVLCAECHDPGDMGTVAAHKQKGKTDCTTCHNPHQSEERFLLKPKARLTGSVPTAQPGRGEASRQASHSPATSDIGGAVANPVTTLVATNRAAPDDATVRGK